MTAGSGMRAASVAPAKSAAVGEEVDSHTDNGIENSIQAGLLKYSSKPVELVELVESMERGAARPGEEGEEGKDDGNIFPKWFPFNIKIK